MAAIINVIDMYKQRRNYKKHIQSLIEEKLNNSFYGYGSSNFFVENHADISFTPCTLFDCISRRRDADFSYFNEDNSDWSEFYYDEDEWP